MKDFFVEDDNQGEYSDKQGKYHNDPFKGIETSITTLTTNILV